MGLQPEALWTAPLQPGEGGGRHGHVRLLDEAVLGCWFSLERESGRRLWSGRPRRADRIVSVTGGSIVATQVCPTPHGEEERGVYVFERATGRRAWSFLAPGWSGWVLALLDLIPGHPNPWRDAPLAVLEDCLVTRAGWVLDLADGAIVEKKRTSAAEAKGASQAASSLPSNADLSRQLYFQKIAPIGGEGDALLRELDPAEPLGCTRNRHCETYLGPRLNFGRVDSAGAILWLYEPGELGRAVQGNWYGSRVHAPHLFLLERDVTNAFYLKALDLASGSVVLDRSLDGYPPGPPTIQDIDDRGLLLGFGSTTAEDLSALAFIPYL